MIILSIDPGCLESQYLLLSGNSVLGHGHMPNEELLAKLPEMLKANVVSVCIEGVQGMGMIVGQEVFDTALWVGRYFQACVHCGHVPKIIYRRQVKLNICGDSRAKDPNIRQALLDRFGGKEAAIGKKAAKGPLYGVSSHAWSALALAITFRELDEKIASTSCGK